MFDLQLASCSSQSIVARSMNSSTDRDSRSVESSVCFPSPPLDPLARSHFRPYRDSAGSLEVYRSAATSLVRFW